MSRSIDERIVQMEFENGNFERNAKTTMSTIDKLKDSLNFDDASRGMQRFADSTSSIFDRLKESLNFGNLFGGLKNLGDAVPKLSGLEMPFDLAGPTSLLSRFTGEANAADFSTLLNNIDEVAARFSTMGIVGAEVIRKITDKVIALGNQMIHSLVLDQFNAGFSKYEQSTKDVIAIMNQAEKDEETVNKYIKTLSWYSDVTSFDANSMTSALKTFAAQGIDLEKAIPVIMGIGNSVTFAGQSAKEGSAAFDAYSKAIASGYLGNREWITLQRGLGVATLGLKKQFIQAAEAAGTLKYSGDGVWKTMEGLDVTIENFQTTLGHQKGKWVTTDVIMQVFGKEYGSYTEKLAAFTEEYQRQNGVVLTLTEAMELLGDNTDAMGQKYLLSATQARTYSEAIDAVKDASSTVWKNIFVDIFGTTTEAISLWTSLSDKLFDIFVTPLSNTEQIIAGWKELGGRTTAIDAIARGFGALEKAVAPVKEAFRNIFPSLTSSDLIDFTNMFANLTFRMNSFFSTQFNSEGLRKTFEGLFAAVDIVKEGFKALLDAASPVGDIFATITNKVLDLTGTLGGYVVSLRDTINEHNSFKDALSGIKGGIEKFGDALKGAFSGKQIQLAGTLGKIFDGMKFSIEHLSVIGASAFGVLKKAIKAVFDTITTGVGSITLVNILNGTIFTNIILNIKKLTDNLKNFKPADILKPWNIMGELKKLFGDLSSVLQTFTANIKADMLLKIAGSIMILAISISALSTIPSEDLGRALGAMASLMAGLGGLFKVINSGGNAMAALKKVGSTIISISAGLLILSFALKTLSGIPWPEMGDGLIALAALGTGLLIFLKYANFGTIGIKAGLGMIGLALGIRIMAGALKTFSKIDPDYLGQALGAFAVVLLGIGLAVNNMPKNMLSIGAGLLMVSVGIGIISAGLRLLATMKPEQLGVALIAFGGAMFIVAAALNAAKETIGGAFAILIFAGALAVLTPALIALSLADPAKIGMALLELVGVFVVFGAAVKAYDHFGIDTALTKLGLSMIALGAGTVILAAGLAILANQPFWGMIGGVVAMAAALAVFGLAATFLAPLAVPMLIVAGVLAAIGLAAAVFGGGVLVIGIGISALAAALTLIGPVTGVFFLIAAGVAAFGLGALVAAAGIFVLGLAMGAFASAAMLLAPTIPIILKLSLAIGALALATIAVIAAIKYLAGNLSIGEDLAKIGEKVRAGFDNMITGLKLFFLNMLKGMLKDIPVFGDRIAASLDEKIKAIEDETMAEKRSQAMGETYAAGIVKGMDAKAEAIYLEGQHLGEEASKGLDSKSGNWFNSAASYVSSFIKGLNSKSGSVTSASRAIARNAEKAMKYELQIESPSKEFEYIGEMTDAGFIEGVEGDSPAVLDSVKNLASNVLGGFKDAIGEKLEIPEVDTTNLAKSLPKSLGEGFDIGALSEFDAAPVVTPVLDLSEIQNGASGIESILNGQSVSADISGLTSANTMHQSNVETDLTSIKDDLYRLLSIHDRYVSTTDQRDRGLIEGFKDSIEGLGVYMDETKVGRLVDKYQSNVRRAAGV